MDDEKPPLDAALRHLAEQQRQSLTSHPTPQELASYHAGELPPEAESRLLDHLAVCRDCSDLLLDLSGFADLKPPEGVPELTDEQVEEDWQALRTKMRTEAPQAPPRTAEVVPIRPAGPSVKPGRIYPVWLPVAASLLAVLGFSFGLYKDWQMRQLTQPTWAHLVSVGANERGSEPVQSFSAADTKVIRLVPEDLQADYPSYEAVILRGEEVLARLSLPTIDEAEPLLSIPPGALEPGGYSVNLYGIDGARRDLLTEVAFRINAP